MITDQSSLTNKISTNENFPSSFISINSSNILTSHFSSDSVKTTNRVEHLITTEQIKTTNPDENLITTEKISVTSSYLNKSTHFTSISWIDEVTETVDYWNQTSNVNSSQIFSTPSIEIEQNKKKSNLAIYVTVAVVSSAIIILAGLIIFKKYILKYIKKENSNNNNEIELF